MGLSQNTNLVVPCAFSPQLFSYLFPKCYFPPSILTLRLYQRGKQRFKEPESDLPGFFSMRGWVRLDAEKSMREDEGWHRERKGKISWRDRKGSVPTRSGKQCGFWNCTIWVWIPILLLHNKYLTLGRLFCLSLPQFPSFTKWRQIQLRTYHTLI